MNNTFFDEIRPVKRNQDFTSTDTRGKKYSYILCTKYGHEGLIPTISKRNCSACISSSGDSMCGCFHGATQFEGTDIYIVKCSGNMECYIEY